MAFPFWPSRRALASLRSPVQDPVLYRFGHVARPHVVRAVEIGERPRELEHPVVRARGKSQFDDCGFQYLIGCCIHPYFARQFARPHVRVRVHARHVTKSVQLPVTSRLHPRPHNAA